MTPDQLRIKALRRFALSITILTIAGHAFLGFETADLQPIVSVLAAYSTELILETVGAFSANRRPSYLGGGLGGFITFLLPAHITGLAIGMLIYAQDQYLPYVLAATTAIASKAIFTVTVRGKPRHFLNPSNFGIATAFLTFENISVTGPYQFTENLHGIWTWSLPLLVLVTGSLLNAKLTGRIAVVFSWWAGFAAQAIVRHFLFGTWLEASLDTMTGTGFVIYSMYMISDPATTPPGLRGQVIFGFSLAAIYGVLVWAHVAYMVFIALVTLTLARGILLAIFEAGYLPAVVKFLNPTVTPMKVPAVRDHSPIGAVP